MALLAVLALALFATHGFVVEEPDDALMKEAKAGDVTAEFEIGERFLRDGDDLKQAEIWLVKAAEAGNSKAQLLLGDLYSGKRLGKPNLVRAVMWYDKAAAQGDAQAKEIVCYAYVRALVPTDSAQTFQACDRSATAGGPYGLAVVGDAYAHGTLGLAINGQKAVDYLTRADAAGETSAARTLGILYFEGQIIGQDYSKSAGLFRRALVNSDFDAAYWLARQYEQGLGVTAEPAEAGRLYFFSASEGNSEAKAWIEAHTEVDAGWLIKNVVSWHTEPPGTWTVTKILSDNSKTEIDIETYFFGSSQDYYPKRAQRELISGDSWIDCHWNSIGELDNCLVVKESPEGYGFGRAAINMLSRPADITQKVEWVRKVAGHTGRFRVRFKIRY